MELDVVAERLLEALRAARPGAEPRYRSAPAPIHGGFDSSLYGFELEAAPGLPAGPLVLRIAKKAREPDRVRMELAVQRALRELGFPVPRVDLADFGEETFGGPFLVMERLAGASLLAGLEMRAGGEIGLAVARTLRSLPAVLGALPRALAETQARLHALPVEPVRQAVKSAGADGEILRVDAWFARLELRLLAVRAPGALAPALEGLLEALARARSRPVPRGGAVVCHGDMHPENVLFRDREVSGVIDWARTKLADPAYDVAATRFVLELAPLAAPPGLVRAVEAAGRHLARRFVDAYRALRPLDEDALDYYEPFRCLDHLIGVALDRLDPTLGDWRNPFDLPRPLQRLCERLHRRTGVRVALPPPP